ncbi:FAD/NAD(P)-binding domain-containing protein [Poronia punctata]|nr:FAD/NAD(P)-binding domain-containing protein [Poronia punctata]
MLGKIILVIRAAGTVISFATYIGIRSARLRLRRIWHHISQPSSPRELKPKQRNIVIIGASMAGYTAARAIAESLLPGSPYRIVVVEPRDYFHFTWVLPRFSVVEGHEHKAFIPYGPYLRAIPDGVLRWIQSRVTHITREHALLASGEKVPYEFLLVATGAGATDVLPNRTGADGRAEGILKLQELQLKIKESKKLVVVGGGAAGVELATDAKTQYPDKSVVLVHSREAVMHRFGPELQKAAMEGLKDLGIEVMTADRLVSHDHDRGVAMLKSGREIECDFLVTCMGQKPNSKLVAELSPDTITPTCHVLVKPTMQIKDDSLPNVYVCGDVAEANIPNPNSRSAASQALIAADNIALAIDGHKPTNRYKPLWLEGLIKLTLGLHKSVTHIGDFNGTEMLFPAKEKDVALMSGGAWKHLGATPFEDDTEALRRFLSES